MKPHVSIVSLDQKSGAADTTRRNFTRGANIGMVVTQPSGYALMGNGMRRGSSRSPNRSTKEGTDRAFRRDDRTGLFQPG
jgi:hypothetical protein